MRYDINLYRTQGCVKPDILAFCKNLSMDWIGCAILAGLQGAGTPHARRGPGASDITPGRGSGRDSPDGIQPADG